MKQGENVYSDLPIPPGEFLLEELQKRSMAQADLARRMGRPSQVINEIIKGEKALTSDTALQLEKVVGIPASVWLNLEAEYQLTKARQQEQAQLAKEAELLDQIPYSDMVKWGWVPKVKAVAEKVRELRRFFAVASLHNIPDVKAYAPAFRRVKESSPYAVAAWLRQAEIVADKLYVEDFNPQGLQEHIEEFRKATLKDPSQFEPKLRGLLARYGVAFVLLPHLRGTYANGATFWTASGKPVLLISLRGKWADIFWFSFFHELAHLVLHGKRDVFVEGGKELDPERRVLEAEANAFAGDTLIPVKPYLNFVRQGDFSKMGIKTFAEQIGIHAGIIVGRLQHDEIILPSQHHDLRLQYVWKEAQE